MPFPWMQGRPSLAPRVLMADGAQLLPSVLPTADHNRPRDKQKAQSVLVPRSEDSAMRFILPSAPPLQMG